MVCVRVYFERETRQFTPKSVDYGRHRFVMVLKIEEVILELIREDPE